MMKLNLTGSKEDRQYVMEQNNVGEIDLIDMLKKFGEVTDYMTEPMVANFYGVDKSCIMGYGNRNSEELSQYGYKVVKGEELKQLKEYNKQTGCLSVKSNAKAVRLYPIKAVILIGMMLTESVVAAKLRRDIMNKIFKPKDDIEQRLDRLENMMITMVKSLGDVVEKLATNTKYVEGPKVEAPKVKTPYTITPIAKPFGIKAANANKILAKNGIISKGDKGGWILNEKYEEAGWGITCDAGQHNGPFVRYTEKGKQATTKILSRSSNQEQIKLF